MKAVIETATGIVVFLVGDNDKLTLTKSGLSGVIRALDITTTTHKIETVTDNPDFLGGVWRWEGEWIVKDQERLDAWKTERDARLQEEYAQRTAAEVTQAIDALHVATCKAYEYDNMNNATGWAPFYPKAMALALWGKACWDKSTEIRDDVIAGNRPIPTVEEVISEMPIFDPPN